MVRPAVEGVQEFKVLTNNTGAEYGRAGGAVVLMTSKSGSNRLAGSLFEYLRNDALDARNFFARPGAPTPPYILNQFGASLGGPVRLPHYNGKDRTFFFADYEGYREVFGVRRWSPCPRPPRGRVIFKESTPTGFTTR